MERTTAKYEQPVSTFETKSRYVLSVLLIFCGLFLWPLWQPLANAIKNNVVDDSEFTFMRVVTQLTDSHNIRHPLLLPYASWMCQKCSGTALCSVQAVFQYVYDRTFIVTCIETVPYIAYLGLIYITGAALALLDYRRVWGKAICATSLLLIAAIIEYQTKATIGSAMYCLAVATVLL
jgi:hypothetical protein